MQCRLVRPLDVEACSCSLRPCLVHPKIQKRTGPCLLLFSLLPSTGTASANQPTALASDGNQTNLSIWGLFCKENISVCPLLLTWGSLAKQIFLCVNWNWLADLFLSLQILKHSGCWGLLPCCRKWFCWMNYVSYYLLINTSLIPVPHVYYCYYFHSLNSNSTIIVARLACTNNCYPLFLLSFSELIP